MRLALIQFNPTVGDLAGNAERMLALAGDARAKGADLAVFPELALCGYPPRDLILQRGFVRDCARAAAGLARRIGDACPGLAVVFGAPLPARDPSLLSADQMMDPAHHGGVCNSLLAYRDGKMLGYYDKRLLPTYDVFDEDRYFVPGDRPVVIDVAGVKVGLSICEDLWRGEDVGFASRYLLSPDPVRELVSAGAQVIVNPSASPFVLGKSARHRDLLRRHARGAGVYVAGVNQIGGNDELVFDGRAVVFHPAGTLLAIGPMFEEAVVLVDLPAPKGREGVGTGAAAAGSIGASDIEDDEALFRALVLGVRDYCRKTAFKEVLLGLSGGIDSAVTAVIAAAALGPERVMGVGLPSAISSEGSVGDARILAENLGLRFELVGIQQAVDALNAAAAPVFEKEGCTEFTLAEENVQSRARGTILMTFSNKLGRLLLTTGNKTELAVGYCTLYGDMNGGLAVLSDITKRWVYRLARWMNANHAKLGIPGIPGSTGLAKGPIPEASISKPPSAELRPNQTDQDTLPLYDVLDEIVERYVEKRQAPAEIAAAMNIEREIAARWARAIDRAEFKRKQAAIGLKVTGVAFGTGRRMPIAQRYSPEN